ncbi:MAG: hypothetical protein ACPKM0_12955 [Pleomorphochaeta sp.]
MKKNLLLFSILLATFMFNSCNNQSQFTEMTFINESDKEITLISFSANLAGTKAISYRPSNNLKDGETIGINDSIVYYLPVLTDDTVLCFYLETEDETEALNISYVYHSNFTLTYNGHDSFTIDGAEIIESNA